MSLPTTYVLGLGNVLMGDDGFGPAVIQAFQAAYVVGSNVDVVDLGTPGLDLAPWLADAENVILIDTVKSKHPAGTLFVYDKNDVLRHPPTARIGPHDPGVKQALLALEFAGRGPRALTLIGVVPEHITMSTELSTAVRAAIPRAIDALIDALGRFAESAVRRPEPLCHSAPWTIGLP
jgi:hydrogenase maturation protease